MAIFYNESKINDWNFGDDNIIKVYYDNAVCYYKVISSGDTPTFDVCYAVVDDISQYQETEFEDVFNKADNSWYKLNNLSQYEKYGLYGSGLSITTYEGKLTIYDGYEYIYSGGSWVNLGEVSGSTATLPNVPFTINYNAKNFDQATQTFAKTEGQLANVDAIVTAGTVTYNSDGYVSVNINSKATIIGYDSYFNRSSSAPNLTIISKQLTDGNKCHLLANRNSNYNWMYRAYNNRLTLHGASEQGGVAVTQQPVIESVRVDSNRTATYNNYTDNTSSTNNNFDYGSSNSGGVALFAGYVPLGSEYFKGDFYWIYMSQNTLTDEQVQQVIDYNEGNGGETIYPLEYTVKSDPLNNLTFNTMAEAQTYAYNNCVYDGMKATIDGNRYYFDSSDENGWVENESRLPQGYTEVEYIENTSTAYIDTGAYLNTSNFEIGYTIGNKQQLFGYCHQGCGGCTWLGVEQSAIMFWGDNDNNAFISSYLTSGDNTIIFTPSGATINGTSISKTLSIGSDDIRNISLLIFARYDFNSNTIEHRTDSYMQLKSFYLKNNGTLVRDLVPCIRDSDNKYGMYDIVNDVFYLSPNNVDFIGGEPIN